MLLQQSQVKVELVLGPLTIALDTISREGQLLSVAVGVLSTDKTSPAIPPHKPPKTPVLLEPIVIQKIDWATLPHWKVISTWVKGHGTIEHLFSEQHQVHP